MESLSGQIEWNSCRLEGGLGDSIIESEIDSPPVTLSVADNHSCATPQIDGDDDGATGGAPTKLWEINNSMSPLHGCPLFY